MWQNGFVRFVTIFMQSLEDPPKGGNGYEWQIDKSYFIVKRKYNVEKFKTGDYPSKESVQDKLIRITDSANNSSKKNYGSKVNGPWVFGMVQQKKSTLNKNKEIERNNKIEMNANTHSKHPNDREQREKHYNDKRKLNTRENRIYDYIKKRKYESLVLKKTVQNICG